MCAFHPSHLRASAVAGFHEHAFFSEAEAARGTSSCFAKVRHESSSWTRFVCRLVSCPPGRGLAPAPDPGLTSKLTCGFVGGLREGRRLSEGFRRWDERGDGSDGTT